MNTLSAAGAADATAVGGAQREVYLDHNASTAPDPAVIAAMHECLLRDWANPSSKHAPGQAARRRLSEARTAVASLVGAQPNEVVFTSGATEANCSVLHGLVAVASASASASASQPPRVLLSAIEHAAFQRAAQALAAQGRIALQYLPVGRDGRVVVDAVRAMLSDGAELVSLMAANNETGALQPYAEVAALARDAGARMHVDATQWIGKLPFDFSASGADFVSVSAHKLYGPKGVGALLLRKGLTWPPLFAGSQERGRRGGTENLPGIVGFGVAARLAAARLHDDAQHLQVLRDRLEAGLCRSLPVEVFAGTSPRLPNTSFLRIAALDADLVLSRLAQRGFHAASGAACSAGGHEASPVLRAMGVVDAQARAALRISLGRDTTLAAIERLLVELPPLLRAALAEAA